MNAMIPRLRCIGCVTAVVVAACTTPPHVRAPVKPLGASDSLAAAIEVALPRFRIDSGTVFGMSTEGAFVAVHYEGDKLRRVMAEFLGEMGRATEVYYFDSALFLVMHTVVTYTAPLSGVVRDSSVTRFDLLRDTSRVLRDSLNAEARALLDALKAR